MGSAVKPEGFFGSISTLETRLSRERVRANRWRTVAWVAIFALAVLTLVVL